MPLNPFQYLLPVGPDLFVGRWPLVKQMALDLILDQGDSYAVVAGRRCGKSSLLGVLSDELRQSTMLAAGDWIALPVSFDFKREAFDSGEGVMAQILRDVRRRIDIAVRRRPCDAWIYSCPLDANWFVQLCEQRKISLSDFEDAIGYVLDQVDQRSKHVRLILLLDEIDETIDQSWTEPLFNQMRTLVYSSDLKTRIRLVIAGSRRFLEQVSRRGSPLWNVLKLRYLAALDKAAIGQLAARAEGITEEISDSIWKYSGGHPFIAQYLLHYAWESDIADCTERVIDRLAMRFLHEESSHFEGWASAVGTTGFRTYDVLKDLSEWTEERVIIERVNDPQLNVKRALTALCYHAIAVHDDGWENYKWTGELFRKWFEDEGIAFLSRLESQTEDASSVSQITAETVVLGSGAHIQHGDKLSIGDVRNSSGIGLHSSHREEETICGKGDSRGSLPGGTITVGDISNAKGVAVGHQALVSVAETGASSNREFERLFVALMQKVNALPEGPDKNVALNATKALEAEANKGEKVDEGTISRWLYFLAESAPDAWQVAVESFSNAATGLGTAFKNTAERAKAEGSDKRGSR